MERPSHPHGVQPEGSLWFQGPDAVAAARTKRSAGLGPRLGRLADATLLEICRFGGVEMLASMCASSDALAAFASFEELWKPLCLARFVVSTREFKNFQDICHFERSWKASCLKFLRATSRGGGGDAAAQALPVAERSRGVSVYSDLLYQPHEVSHGPSPFGAKPKGPRCARVKSPASCQPDAVASFEVGAGRPVVLEGAGAEAAADSTWDEPSMRRILGDRVFHAGGVNFKLKDYFEYAGRNMDDPPLYLFDPTFEKSAPELVRAYSTPPCFRDDLFALLDESGSRPDYRWLLVGGKRSGQSWHKDPNGTSAWNLTVRGRKRWLFFPPHKTPPGVIPSADGEDYVTPLSLAEWARTFYQEACASPGFLECETGPGDVMYVPRGWWHMVLNVAPLTVAVSHHFLSPAGLSNTLRLLRESPHEVSGVDRGLKAGATGGAGGALDGDGAGVRAVPRTEDERAEDDHARRTAAGTALHDRLVAAIGERRPEALARAEGELSRGHLRECEPGNMVPKQPPKKKRVVTVGKELVAAVSGASGPPAAFSFNFGS